MSNPYVRRIQARLGQIRQLEKECIYTLIEHPDCFTKQREKDAMIELAIAHIESKLNRVTSENSSYANAVTIYLSIALQEYEGSGEKLKKKTAQKVTERLLEFSEADLMAVPEELQVAAFDVACIFLREL